VTPARPLGPSTGTNRGKRAGENVAMASARALRYAITACHSHAEISFSKSGRHHRARGHLRRRSQCRWLFSRLVWGLPHGQLELGGSSSSGQRQRSASTSAQRGNEASPLRSEVVELHAKGGMICGVPRWYPTSRRWVSGLGATMSRNAKPELIGTGSRRGCPPGGRRRGKGSAGMTDGGRHRLSPKPRPACRRAHSARLRPLMGAARCLAEALFRPRPLPAQHVRTAYQLRGGIPEAEP
jgi:hypothetical protein